MSSLFMLSQEDYAYWATKHFVSSIVDDDPLSDMITQVLLNSYRREDGTLIGLPELLLNVENIDDLC